MYFGEQAPSRFTSAWGAIAPWPSCSPAPATGDKYEWFCDTLSGLTINTYTEIVAAKIRFQGKNKRTLKRARC